MKINKQTKVRDLLQIIGTDLLRNQLHQNIWVNALMNKYLCSCGDDLVESEITHVIFENCKEPNWIIPDCRFENEVLAIKDRNGIVIRVNRINSTPQTTYVNNLIRTHPSETTLDNYTFDYVIDNNGTIKNLIKQVKKILIQEKLL